MRAFVERSIIRPLSAEVLSLSWTYEN